MDYRWLRYYVVVIFQGGAAGSSGQVGAGGTVGGTQAAPGGAGGGVGNTAPPAGMPRGAVMGQQQQGQQRFVMGHPGQTPPHQQQYSSAQANMVRCFSYVVSYTCSAKCYVTITRN